MRISTRALGRATLARQLLLERSTHTPLGGVEHLVGLQAQTPHTWYVGLWSRLRDFRPHEVSELLLARDLVRVALMRSTIHLVTARDCLAVRPLVQAAIVRSTDAVYGKGLAGVDRGELAAAARDLLAEGPMVASELGRALLPRFPGRDPVALANTVRAHETLVQVPPRGLWGRSGKAAHATARTWLGAEPGTGLTVDALVLRYLGAFGPAAPADAQTWSGLTRLAEVFERQRPDLVAMRDASGRELFDLPDAPRPGADVAAPVRYLYDFDNLLLSHADRSRVVTGDVAAQSYPPYGPVPRMLLVDGVTAGDWTVDVTRERATLTVTPFRRLRARERDEVVAEGARLLGFLAAGAHHDVRVVPPRSEI